MTLSKLYPLLLRPSLHIKVWGGRQLETLNKSLPTSDPYGEAWELHDSATVGNGNYAGRTVADVLLEHGHDLIGTHNDPTQGMPLLAKFLDSAEWLSVQVHPNDEQAKRLEGDPRGKTEAWVILATQPGAQLVIGVKPGTTQQEMSNTIQTNTLEDLLVYQEVQAGDVLFIAANTIHAVGPGILLYEIQQSSDMTYRLYDWGRVGLDGNPRPLHIEKGTQISNLDSLPPITNINQRGNDQIIIHNEFFETAYLDLSHIEIRHRNA